MEHLTKTWLFFILATTAIVGASAAEQTTLSQPWSNHSFIASNGPFENVLVIAVTREPEYRPMLEEAFSKEIGKTKASATSSVSIMSADEEVTEENVKAAVAAAGKEFDIVLLTRLYRIDEADIVNTTDPGTKRSERDFALGLWGDWRGARDYALDAGVTKRLRYVLENNVYDLESAELIWTVQSYTLDTSVKEDIKSVSKLVTEQLRKDRLI